MVSGVLATTARHAADRVQQAVRLAADGPEGTDTATGLGGLHAAMAAGRLDGYRAGVVARELEECPPDVAATVVTGLDPHLETEDSTALRRRVRRMLARISPDLLRQRAVRARSECRLERWVEEPGVDGWHGTFPSEQAATAWAAVDRLAQRYVADGRFERVDQARAAALMDLVAGNTTVDVQVTVVSARTTEAADADAVPERGAVAGGRERDPGTRVGAPTRRTLVGDPADDLVEVAGLHPTETALVGRAWLDRAIAATELRRDRAGRVALAAPDVDVSSSGYRPSDRVVAAVRARDGHCRFPGCHVAARFCDVDHVRPWPGGPTSIANLVLLCRRHHRVKQRPGWTVRLDPDGTLTWTDPTGRVRTTTPRHPADLVTLTSSPDEARLPLRFPADRPELDAPHSALEFSLEHHQHGRVVRFVVDLDRNRHRPTVPDTPPF